MKTYYFVALAFGGLVVIWANIVIHEWYMGTVRKGK